MKLQLKADLEQAIQEWADGNCEGDEWPHFCCADTLVSCMTEVAASVFDTAVESQKCAIREEYLEVRRA